MTLNNWQALQQPARLNPLGAGSFNDWAVTHPEVKVEPFVLPVVTEIHKQLSPYFVDGRYHWRLYATEKYIWYSADHESIGVYATKAEAEAEALRASFWSLDTDDAIKFALQEPDRARELLERFGEK